MYFRTLEQSWQQGCTALYSSLTAGSPAATLQSTSEHYNKVDSRCSHLCLQHQLYKAPLQCAANVSSTNPTSGHHNKVAHSKPHFNIVFITSTNLFNAFYELYTAVCYAFHQIEAAQAFSDIALFRPLLQLSSKQAGFRRRFLGKLPCFQFLLTRPFSLFDILAFCWWWQIWILVCESFISYTVKGGPYIYEAALLL